MRRSTAVPAVRHLVVVGLALGAVGCCGERPAIACPQPTAVLIAVVDGAGDAIPAAFVRASGPLLNCPPSSEEGLCVVPCARDRCVIFGHSGTYSVEAGAPGFQSRRISINARDTTGRCDFCESVATVDIRIALVAS